MNLDWHDILLITATMLCKLANDDSTFVEQQMLQLLLNKIMLSIVSCDVLSSSCLLNGFDQSFLFWSTSCTNVQQLLINKRWIMLNCVGCVENEDPKTKTEDLRPCGLKRRPTGLKRRPTGLKRRPTGLKRRPTGLKRRPTGLKRRPTSLKRRPTGLKRRPTGLNRRPTSRLGQGYATFSWQSLFRHFRQFHILYISPKAPWPSCLFNPGLLTCIRDTFCRRSLLFLRIAGA